MPAGDPGSPPEQSRTALRADASRRAAACLRLAAAAQLAAAGADVVLLEEAGELGGQYYKRRLGAVRARYGDYRPAGSRLIAATRARRASGA